VAKLARGWARAAGGGPGLLPGAGPVRGRTMRGGKATPGAARGERVEGGHPLSCLAGHSQPRSHGGQVLKSSVDFSVGGRNE
jgi:hypothetical protein